MSISLSATESNPLWFELSAMAEEFRPPRLLLDCLILSLRCGLLLIRGCFGESITLIDDPKFLLSLADCLSMPRRARELSLLIPVFGRAFIGIFALLPPPITMEAFEMFLSSVVVLCMLRSRGDFVMLRFVRLYDL